jgi:hypothetical protein
MTSTFRRFAGYYAIVTGVAGFLYSLSFIVLQSNLLSAVFLMLGGLFATAAIVALYHLLRETEAAFALWAFIFALAGALGSALHAGYDLANAIHVPATLNADLPSPVDPRGLTTFGLAGIGLLVFAWLITRGNQFPRTLGYLA